MTPGKLILVVLASVRAGQFRRLALDQARAAGFASLPYSLLSIDLFADPLPADLPPRPRVILAYVRALSLISRRPQYGG